MTPPPPPPLTTTQRAILVAVLGLTLFLLLWPPIYWDYRHLDDCLAQGGGWGYCLATL